MVRPKNERADIAIRTSAVKGTIALRDLALRIEARAPVNYVRSYSAVLHGQACLVRVCPPASAEGVLTWSSRPLSGRGRGPD